MMVEYFLIIIFIWCSILAPSSSKKQTVPKGVYEIKLNNHWLYWNYNWDEQWVKFEVHAHLEKDQWFGLGFSDRGTTTDADICILHNDTRGVITVVDGWIDDKCLFQVDFKQDCRAFDYTVVDNITIFTFVKTFDSCDIRDYLFQEGTTHIIWIRGYGKLEVEQSLCGQVEDGTTFTTLLRVENEPFPDEGKWSFAAHVPDIVVPSTETTYWCHLSQFPDKISLRKHHLVGFKAVIDEGHENLVHHMELFHCEIPAWKKLKHYSGPCDKKPSELEVCKKVIAAWAMGASPFHYPPKAGLPVGGKEYSRYVMLEIHYDNPDSTFSGKTDCSGLQVYVTPILRPFDAGVIELGLEYTDKMAIPPNQSAFHLTGHCIAECISVGVPFGGIWIFASQLHTHLTGVKVETIIVKKGVEAAYVDYDYHYSPHYQEIRLMRERTFVFPGTALLTRCTYDTSHRATVTLGGFSTSDEMCVNYIYYYPKVDLEVCKSSIADHDLNSYFWSLYKLENQKTQANLPISQKYKNIEWTPLRVHVLDELYTLSNIYMQCNKSDGNRFPGRWHKMKPTDIKKHIPPLGRNCPFL